MFLRSGIGTDCKVLYRIFRQGGERSACAAHPILKFATYETASGGYSDHIITSLIGTIH